MNGDTKTTQGAIFLDRQLRDMAPHRAVLRAVESRYMSRIEFHRPILDVGCGDGHFADCCWNEPVDVGLDPSERALAECAARGLRVYRVLVQASATRMPFGDGVFATVVSNSVLEHIPDIDRVLREIARVLKPGGIFAATMPAPAFAEFLLGSTTLHRLGLDRAARAYGRWFNRISQHFHVDSPELWAERLNAVGLMPVEQEEYFSPSAHRAFDAAHWLGVPNLFTRKLFGKWVLHPAQMTPFRWWLGRYVDEPTPERGAYQYVRCVKRD